MKELLKKDISVKVISVLLGFLLWIIVLNTENPYSNKTFTIRLNTENQHVLQERDLVLKNQNFRDTIDITIRGRKEVLEKVRPTDFTATLDFSKVRSINDSRVMVDGPYYDVGEVTLVRVEPRYIDLQLEKIAEGTFPVELEVINNLKGNYRIVDVTHFPEEVEFRDLESIINNIGLVKAIIDIDNSDNNLVLKKEYKVYDKNEQEMVSLSRKVELEVDVQIAKEVPVELVVRGTLAQDYIEVGRDINPKTALITGPYKAIEEVNKLITEPVDIGSIGQSLAKNVTILLPEQVALVNTPKEAHVIIDVEKLETREFSIDKDNISIRNAIEDEQIKYEILGTSGSFSIKGKQSELQGLTAASFNPFLDVAGLQEGTHTLSIKVSVPTGLELIRADQMDVRIQRIVAQQ